MKTNRIVMYQRTAKLFAFTLGMITLVIVAIAARPQASRGPKGTVPLKEAKLNIEHNATDHDTGFQGAIDSEGWDRLDLNGPGGVQLHFTASGALGKLGLTELFFESVEPANIDKPLDELLSELPAGEYQFRTHEMIDGERGGEVVGTAHLTHDIPAGPELISPMTNAVVPTQNVEMRWSAVTRSLRGGPIDIISYQLIVEKDVPVHPHMIGKWGLSMYLPPTVTSMELPRGFLEPGTSYKWEVLAIEASGNQTLSSGAFRTQ